MTYTGNDSLDALFYGAAKSDFHRDSTVCRLACHRRTRIRS